MSSDNNDPPPLNGLIETITDIDSQSCELLGPTALIVQGLLGVLVILSLVYKRHREVNKRPWRIWLFDVSKQVVGQMFVHGVNVLASHVGSDHTDSNACVIYFLNILIDTTFGVALIYVIHRFFTFIVSEKLGLKGFESGIYGTPPSFRFWARQAALYVLTLTTMKMMVLGLVALFPGIYRIGAWLLSWTWTGDGDAVQVIFTMGVFPIIMNIIQFWLIDSIVKASANITLDSDSTNPGDNDDEHREPLFGAPSDDEDDDSYKPNDIENQRHRRSSQSSSESLRYSRDKSFTSTTDITIPDEPKSVASTSNSVPHDEHSYPPNMTNSISSLSTSDSHKVPKPAKNLMKKKRRGPPAPLHIPRVGRPVVNSPQVSATTIPTSIPKTPEPAPEKRPPTIVKQSSDVNSNSNVNSNEWTDSWDDEDDWANKVGEEDWTGKRIEDKRNDVQGVWAGDATGIRT